MKKLLILMLTITILIAIKFIFFNTSEIENKFTTNEICIKTSKDEVIKKDTSLKDKQIYVKKTDESDNQINNKIKQLLKKAENLLIKSKDEEALKIYDLIIEKIADSNDTKLLKHFASACMSKGYLYQIYPNIDNDSAIEAYSMIINKFEKSKDTELIQLYIDAKVQLSYLLPYDEKTEAYNEILTKFENSTDINIQKRIESLLITKSFQLMGQNDEEAMQILDKVIEKYQEKDDNVNLPENIKFSILNNIELALITNNESDTYVELAKKYMSNSPDTKPLLDMLDIIKNSQDLNQDEAMQIWKEEHGDYHFPDWSFQEVERWAYRIEDIETKERVTSYINAFVNQKYNIPNKYSNNPAYNSTTYEDRTKNHNTTTTYDNSYEQEESHDNENENYNSIEDNSENSKDETIENEIIEDEIYENDIPQEDTNDTPIPYKYSDDIIYEPDPYAQEIYEATGEYPNPYE